MYNGSNHFGRAYQEEMHRIAGVSDEHQIEGRWRRKPQEGGLLRRLFGWLSRRGKETQPASPTSIREPRTSMR